MTVAGPTHALNTRHALVSPKPVLRRLLLPLTAILALLVVGAGALFWQQHRGQLSSTITLAGDEAAYDLQRTLEQQAQGLSVAAQPIAADTRVRVALRAGDAERLLADWRGPV